MASASTVNEWGEMDDYTEGEGLYLDLEDHNRVSLKEGEKEKKERGTESLIPFIKNLLGAPLRAVK